MSSTAARRLHPLGVIDRYVLREFVRYYLLAMIGFVAFVVLFDAMEKIDTFLDYDASVGQILRFYAYSLPYKAILVGPVAPLLATFLCLGSMTRFQEVTVLKAAGMSLYRLLLPLYVLGFLLSAATFGLGEGFMPEANRRASEIMEHEIKGRSLKSLGSRNNVTYLGRNNRLFVIRRYDIPRMAMVDATVQEFDGDRMTRRIDARSAIWRNGHWVMVDGMERTFDAAGLERAVPFDTLRTDFPELPGDFAKEEMRPEQMSFTQLRRYAERVRQSGSTVERYETEIQLRFAFPLVSLVVILIGSSLAVQIRRGGIALGFGISLGIAFAYWSLIRAGQVLGNNGTLPPLLAAWLGNLVFIGLGVFLLVRTPK